MADLEQRSRREVAAELREVQEQRDATLARAEIVRRQSEQEAREKALKRQQEVEAADRAREAQQRGEQEKRERLIAQQQRELQWEHERVMQDEAAKPRRLLDEMAAHGLEMWREGDVILLSRRIDFHDQRLATLYAELIQLKAKVLPLLPVERPGPMRV